MGLIIEYGNRLEELTLENLWGKGMQGRNVWINGEGKVYQILL
jgi:hypothetical protein